MDGWMDGWAGHTTSVDFWSEEDKHTHTHTFDDIVINQSRRDQWTGGSNGPSTERTDGRADG